MPLYRQPNLRDEIRPMPQVGPSSDRDDITSREYLEPDRRLTSHILLTFVTSERRAIMAGEYQADLKNLAPKLKAIHGELLYLELSTGAPSFTTGRTVGRNGLGLVRSGRHDLRFTRSTSQACVSCSENATL